MVWDGISRRISHTFCRTAGFPAFSFIAHKDIGDTHTNRPCSRGASGESIHAEFNSSLSFSTSFPSLREGPLSKNRSETISLAKCIKKF